MSGVLCEGNINVSLKRKVYKAVGRPAMMYGPETWSLKKTQERKLEERWKMLRWMYGMAKMDNIRNKRIRGRLKVEKIPERSRRGGCSGMAM